MAAAFLALAQPAAAQQTERRSNPPSPAQTLPSVVQPGQAWQKCPPGDASKGCMARQATIQPVLPAPTSLILRQREFDVVERRFVPPKIVAFLNDPRIDPQTRGALEMVAAKPTKDWTLAQLAMVQQMVPTLTEMKIPTAALSDFYEFLGLDPNQLFEPQLGHWQTGTSAFDARNYDATQQAQCLYLLGVSENPDPSSVTLGNLASCSEHQEE